MNKLLTTITLLCFSVAANAQDADYEIREVIRELFTTKCMNGSVRVSGSCWEFSEVFRLPMMFPELTVANWHIKKYRTGLKSNALRGEKVAIGQHQQMASTFINSRMKSITYMLIGIAFNDADEVIRRFNAAYFYAGDGN